MLLLFVFLCRDVSKDFPKRGLYSPSAPRPRYLSPSCLVGWDKKNGNDQNLLTYTLLDRTPEPSIMLYGGDGGLSSHRYFSETWSLSLRRLAIENSGDDTIPAFCDWRRGPNSNAFKAWRDSCGASNGTGGGECHWRDIIIMAWCEGNYQSFVSPI